MSDESDYTYEYYSSDESVQKKQYNTKKKILIEVESEIPDTTSRIKKLDNKKPAKESVKEPVKKPAKETAKEPAKKPIKETAKAPVKESAMEEDIPRLLEKPVDLQFAEIKATPNPNYKPRLIPKTSLKQQAAVLPQAPPPSPAHQPTPDPLPRQEILPPLTAKKTEEPVGGKNAESSGVAIDRPDDSQSDYYDGDYYSTDSYYYSSGVVKTDFVKLTRDLLAENYNFETLKKIYMECTQQCNPKHLSKEQRAFLDVLYGEMQKRGRCPPP